MSVYVCCLQKKGRISKNTFQYKKNNKSARTWSQSEILRIDHLSITDADFVFCFWGRLENQHIVWFCWIKTEIQRTPKHINW